MNLSIKELNDLYYCVGMMRISDKEVKMVSNEELEKLSDKIWNEIVRLNNEEEERNEIINEMEDIM
jgi:hypothetical protein